MNVLSIGAGYVGGPTMAVMAAQCPEHRFVVADINKERIDAWCSDELPIYEPNLKEIVDDVRGVNLFFTTHIEQAIKEADIIFISVDTPTKVSGEGAGCACDTSKVELVARTICDNLTKDCIVVEKTTVPVGCADMLRDIFFDSMWNVDVLNNPEFLAEGTAIHDLTNPDRVLIGDDGTARGEAASVILKSLYLNWVVSERIIRVNTASAEMSKLAANAMLAQRVSSINALAELCEETGADADELAMAIGSDHRIGPNFLKPGPGFGGSCFKKDVLNLVYIADSLGLKDVANYWYQVISMNTHQQDRIVKRMLKEMYGSLRGKKVTLFGYAFKANTGDVRESPAIRLVRLLLEERADVVVTDPQVSKSLFPDTLDARMGRAARFIEDPYVAAQGAHAIIVATEWPVYKGLNWRTLFNKMQHPAHVFDTRNLLNQGTLREIGFEVWTVGK
jgi:UDPglucose 6-dehydrogenase